MKRRGIVYSINDVPVKESALETLEPLFSVWNHTYEDAVNRGRQHFHDRDRPINSYLFPCIVRHELLTGLAEPSRLVEFQYHPLENNGLLLLYRQYVIRSRKAQIGTVSAPGPSWALQSFYRQFAWIEDMPPPPWVPQQLRLPFPPTPPEYNLMLLWGVNQRYMFEGLWLAAPKFGDANRVKCHWVEPIPYLGRRSVAISQSSIADAVPDLDIIQLDDGEADEAEEDESTGTDLSR